MEALILSCSTGGGHNSAGQAIAAELRSRGWITHFLDPYSLRSQKMADRVGGAYVSMVRVSPSLFGGVYTIGKAYMKAEQAFHLPDPVLAVQKKTALALYDWLTDHPVDIILCSHPYPGLMLTWLKEHGLQVPLSIMIPTDYTCIPFESDIRTDWMTLPHPDLASAFHDEGVELSRMIPSGIPVDPAFARQSPREAAGARLGLDSARRYILVGGGSMGVSGIWMILSELQPLLDEMPDLEMLVLCGSNRTLQKRIDSLALKGVQTVPMTSQMPDYLRLASLFITKPGGLSITEAAVCKTPLLLTSPIPGCETENALFFERHGLALYARESSQLAGMTRLLLNRTADTMQTADPTFENPAARLADWVDCAVRLNSRSHFFNSEVRQAD